MVLGLSVVKPSMVLSTRVPIQKVKVIIPTARAPAMIKMEHPAKGENFPLSLVESAGAASDMHARYLFLDRIDRIFQNFLRLWEFGIWYLRIGV